MTTLPAVSEMRLLAFWPVPPKCQSREARRRYVLIPCRTLLTSCTPSVVAGLPTDCYVDKTRPRTVRNAGGIIGVDISAESLPLAMGRSCCENAVVGNLDEPLALDTGRFDAIISVGVFSYVEKFDTCFDEMVCLARPGASIPLLSSNELLGGGLS